MRFHILYLLIRNPSLKLILAAGCYKESRNSIHSRKKSEVRLTSKLAQRSCRLSESNLSIDIIFSSWNHSYLSTSNEYPLNLSFGILFPYIFWFRWQILKYTTMITSGAKSLDTCTSCRRMEVCSSLSTSVRRPHWHTIHWPIPSTVQVLKTTGSVFVGQLPKKFL